MDKDKLRQKAILYATDIIYVPKDSEIDKAVLDVVSKTFIDGATENEPELAVKAEEYARTQIASTSSNDRAIYAAMIDYYQGVMYAIQSLIAETTKKI